MSDKGLSDLSGRPATREDIHRLRNEVQRLVGDVSTRVIAIDHTVTKLDAQAVLVNPAELIAALRQITLMEKEMHDLREDVEGLKKVVWKAVGATAILSPALLLLAQNMLAQ